MNDFKVVKYSAANYTEWNAFVSHSKNGTFLFHRDFMEYHQDRFEDFSLLIYFKNKLVALLPANKKDHEVYSHQGLTYGGVLFTEQVKFDRVLNIFKSVLQFLKDCSITSFFIKEIPSIYPRVFTEEINYLMFILKAELFRKDTLSVININNKALKISRNRLEGYKRGVKHNLVVKEVEDFELFWNQILIKNLEQKHKAKPVHSLDEITLLKKRFPKNIRQFNVYHDKNIVAGTTIFETEHVAHAQYISGNDDKNTLGSLDFLHHYLINETFNAKRYFDFGTSNENNGLHINKGLQFWKEGFGARTVTQDFYKIDVNNYPLLNTVFI
ncbi:GNAT family N-acetyltransferase [Algibacter pacificus]|uniref:GNAT family N-acetyltransferase n=1 Tax=Algibacter pacificus TaxID=2599389 RepID=UPI0011C6F832|nr:GNAT family N-acetyltransferase [Algibacter pacificus]